MKQVTLRNHVCRLNGVAAGRHLMNDDTGDAQLRRLISQQLRHDILGNCASTRRGIHWLGPSKGRRDKTAR